MEFGKRQPPPEKTFKVTENFALPSEFTQTKPTSPRSPKSQEILTITHQKSCERPFTSDASNSPKRPEILVQLNCNELSVPTSESKPFLHSRNSQPFRSNSIHQDTLMISEGTNSRDEALRAVTNVSTLPLQITGLNQKIASNP